MGSYGNILSKNRKELVGYGSHEYFHPLSKIDDYSIIVDDILLLKVSTYFHASSPKNSHCVRQIPLNTKFHRALLYGLTYGYWKLFE